MQKTNEQQKTYFKLRRRLSKKYIYLHPQSIKIYVFLCQMYVYYVKISIWLYRLCFVRLLRVVLHTKININGPHTQRHTLKLKKEKKRIKETPSFPEKWCESIEKMTKFGVKDIIRNVCERLEPCMPKKKSGEKGSKCV